MYTDKLLSVKTKQRAPLINDISHRNVFFVTITVLQYYCIFVANHTPSQTHIPMNKTDCSLFLYYDAFNIYLCIFMK